MADWKSAEERQFGDFLYVEEVNSNEGLSRRLTGINTSRSVQDLKKAIATELGNPEGWSNITVAFADKELGDRKLEICCISGFITDKPRSHRDPRFFHSAGGECLKLIDICMETDKP